MSPGKIEMVDSETVQLWDAEPPEIQSSISRAVPSALEAAVRHLAALSMGWINWFVETVGRFVNLHCWLSPPVQTQICIYIARAVFRHTS
jgi:hypothetical protein